VEVNILGLKSSFMIAWRSLARRKTKNLSAILAVTLGVTLLVGITITTDTLENAFITSLLQGEGEVDLRITNSTRGGYLSIADQESITNLVPDALGVMPELSTNLPAQIFSQFDPEMTLAGIPVSYPDAFGIFYDWKTGDQMDISSLLGDNKSILLSSKQAERLGLTQDTSLPVTLTTEFTNLSAIITPPTVPLSKWAVNAEGTNTNYFLNSTDSGLQIGISPTNFTSMVTIYTINCPQLNLSSYTHVNITATGTPNTIVMMGFFLDDGSKFDVANLTDVGTLNASLFDLSPYAGKSLNGNGYLTIMSFDGTPAVLNITEIAFETMTPDGFQRVPIIDFVPEISKVEMNVVSIFDSNRPGIGSQYSGAVMRLGHLQDWLSLSDPNRDTDLISTFLVSYKADHFILEIDEDYLQTQVDRVEDSIPENVNSETGNAQKIYRVTSNRLDFISFADFFITLMSTMLTALGFLITLTGVLLITNVQLMSVEDREFQTGVLRAVGANRGGIFQSIIIENLFQGVIGGILGLIGGLAFGEAVAIYLVNLFGTGELSVQPVVSQEAVILSVIIGVVLSIITGILPALRASRVKIVEALRGLKVEFKEKSSRNLAALGVLMILCGIILLLNNGIIDEAYQVFWVSEGWDTLDEWRFLMMGFGLFTGGLAIVLSKFMSRVRAFNIAAITLWVIPSILFVVGMGNWVTDITGLSIDILILGIIEIVIGSILFVALNLPLLMRGLRNILIRLRGVKGVAQISPSLISSHITRSTLTFAIFAIILTLNVLVAALIPTSLGTATQLEEDSKGVDIVIFLNKPEAIINGTSYTNELYKLDNRITDIIGFKTFSPGQDYTKFVALENPLSPDFDATTDFLPITLGEFKAEQIRGNATNYTESNWRYPFFLSGLPDDVRVTSLSDLSDAEIEELSKKGWDKLFDSEYEMAAYNVTSSLLSIFSGEKDISDLDIGGGNGFGGRSDDPLEEVNPLKDNEGNIIKNPIVFTDSMILPLGLQIWIPLNKSTTGFPNYQAFTIGGTLDNQRAGGFPLGAGLSIGGSGDFDFQSIIGTLYLPEYWTNQTDYLGEANGKTLISRESDQYNVYLIKTSLPIDDPEVEDIAQKIEEFTNTNGEGYRDLADDNFYVASSSRTYSRIESTLEMTDRIGSFLQIYVTFGLAIGAVGMGVISVRNVSERKREIGMMRAIGFPRAQVILSVLLELVVLGIIGLLIGIVNGLLVSVGFANMQGVALVIPWEEIGLYLSLIVLIALGAGALPAIVASRIPPAEALRYVG
jgi:ABC-type antimicrobial peptide transport system permease subunit